MLNLAKNRAFFFFRKPKTEKNGETEFRNAKEIYDDAAPGVLLLVIVALLSGVLGIQIGEAAGRLRDQVTQMRKRSPPRPSRKRS